MFVSLFRGAWSNSSIPGLTTRPSSLALMEMKPLLRRATPGATEESTRMDDQLTSAVPYVLTCELELVPRDVRGRGDTAKNRRRKIGPPENLPRLGNLGDAYDTMMRE